MKKIWITVLATVFTLMLAACGNEIPELSDEEMYMVEEYAARLLLKYDANYQGTTLSDEEIAEKRAEAERRADVQAKAEADREAREKKKAEKEAQKASESEDGEGGGESTAAPEKEYADIAAFLGLDGISIEYAGFAFSEVYPMDSDITQGLAHAPSGKKFMVLAFRMSNKSGADKEIDMNAVNPSFTVVLGAGVKKSAQPSMQGDNLLGYTGTLAAGETKDVQLFIEVNANTEPPHTATMNMKKDGESAEAMLFAE
ncbi:MAG: hypothetical protein K5686_05760 [Lachnospiraceae bacterium]|nr:hypothetical protein [Lachnospiraceae bacterium]